MDQSRSQIDDLIEDGGYNRVFHRQGCHNGGMTTIRRLRLRRIDW
jgi:hypothetical protein